MSLVAKISQKVSEAGTIGALIWLMKRGPLKVWLWFRNRCLDPSFPRVGRRSAKRRVFIFASVPYYDIGGGQRSAQLAKTFNHLGYAVHYFFTQYSSEKKIAHMSIPVAEHKYIKRVKKNELVNIIKPDDIVIVEAPNKQFIPLLNIARQRQAKIVYENIDDWETSLGSSFFDEDSLKTILQSADILTGTALNLIKQTEKYLQKFNVHNKKVYYLPNAVDTDLFDPALQHDRPTDLIIGDKTLIYYGTLWGEWFDWKITYEIARHLPDITINLIGDTTNVQQKISTAPQNIHFLGLKKQSDLPAYLMHSDFALLPFKVDKIVESVSPLKIFEYISMNKPVITTTLPEVKNYPNVYRGNTSESWIKILSKQGVKVDKTSAQHFAKKHSWDNRCRQIIAFFK